MTKPQPAVEVFAGIDVSAREISVVRMQDKEGNPTLAAFANNVWLVGLWIDQELNPTTHEERLYIVVSERKHAFFVDLVQKMRPAGCPGKARQFVTTWTLPEW